MQVKDGGPAFPIVADRGERLQSSAGLSLRDYFAAHLAHGMISGGPVDERQKSYEKIASNAYAIADAMLAEREKAK